MSKPAKENKRFVCDICSKSFTLLVHFTKHKKLHRNVKTVKTMLQKQTEHKKKKTREYCSICAKFYSCIASLNFHMKKVHDTKSNKRIPLQKNLLNTSSLNSFKHKLLKKNNKGSQENKCALGTDIFTEFENKLPYELRYDQFRCSICDLITANSNEHMEHEKTHYQMSVINDICVSFEPLSIFDNSLTSDSIRGDFLHQIKCNKCLSTFTVVSDFEEHQNAGCENIKNNKHKNLPIRKLNQHNIKKKKKDDILTSKNKKIFKNYKKKNVSEDHTKALKQLQLVPRQFGCEICLKTCDRLDHLEIHEWWTPVDQNRFECSICFEQFLDKSYLKLHETEHIKKIIY